MRLSTLGQETPCCRTTSRSRTASTRPGGAPAPSSSTWSHRCRDVGRQDLRRRGAQPHDRHRLGGQRPGQRGHGLQQVRVPEPVQRRLRRRVHVPRLRPLLHDDQQLGQQGRGAGLRTARPRRPQHRRPRGTPQDSQVHERGDRPRRGRLPGGRGQARAGGAPGRHHLPPARRARLRRPARHLPRGVRRRRPSRTPRTRRWAR